MAKKKRTPGGDFDFNMTPMIDVTFQLIIFFIIAGQMSSDDIEALIPPEPYRSLASEALRAQQAVIVNIVSLAKNDKNAPDEDAREASMWYVKGKAIEVDDKERLVEAINTVLAGMSEKNRNPPRIEIRCDRRIQYRDVQTVLMAASAAGVADMRITAVVEDK